MGVLLKLVKRSKSEWWLKKLHFVTAKVLPSQAVPGKSVVQTWTQGSVQGGTCTLLPLQLWFAEIPALLIQNFFSKPPWTHVCVEEPSLSGAWLELQHCPVPLALGFSILWQLSLFYVVWRGLNVTKLGFPEAFRFLQRCLLTQYLHALWVLIFSSVLPTTGGWNRVMGSGPRVGWQHHTCCFSNLIKTFQSSRRVILSQFLFKTKSGSVWAVIAWTCLFPELSYWISDKGEEQHQVSIFFSALSTPQTIFNIIFIAL